MSSLGSATISHAAFIREIVFLSFPNRDSGLSKLQIFIVCSYEDEKGPLSGAFFRVFYSFLFSPATVWILVFFAQFVG